MKALKWKVPPLFAFILFAFFMYVGASIDNNWWLLHIPMKLVWVCLLMIVAGVLGITAVLEFSRHQTTLNPINVSKASQLVTTGVFAISRNPIYLGLSLLLLAWGVWLEDGISLCIALGFIPYINRFHIIVEEQALAEKFACQYLDYKAKVRRWI